MVESEGSEIGGVGMGMVNPEGLMKGWVFERVWKSRV